MRNNILKSVLSLIIVISFILSFSSLFYVNAASQAGYINDSYVNVRTSPSTKDGDNKLYLSGKGVQLQSGHSVTVFETVYSLNDSANPKWCYIEFVYSGQTLRGYVAEPYITLYSTGDDYELPVNVPDIYLPYIANLLSNHPNWTFVFLKTGYDWNSLLSTEDGQCVTKRNLISGAPVSYRSTAPDCYNWREDKWIAHDGSSWYQANEQTIAYYLDPRNFLNEETVFMFECLTFNSNIHNENGVANIIKNSFMNNVSIVNQSGQSVLYSKAFMDAAAYSNVSAYHLASRVIQEVGNSGSGSTTGKYPGYEGYYNFYNIGASAGANPIANGLNFAKNGGSLSKSEQEKYMLPWNSQYKSIKGGANWIGSKYITSVHKQNTLYFQKFNTSNPDKDFFYHQYMQNVQAHANEAPRIKRSYSELGLLDSNFTFIVPVYENMPETACKLPVASDNNPNNWLKSLSIDNYSFGFDAAKTDGYYFEVENSVTSVNVTPKPVNANATIVSGSGKKTLVEGNNEISVTVRSQTGVDRTYKVTIKRNKADKIPMTGITLSDSALNLFVGDSNTLSVNYLPSNTTDSKTVIWTSSNPSVATVSNGKVTAVGSGEAIVTAKVGNFTATCKVSVLKDAVTGDIDADGAVTLSDALMIFKYKSGEISLSQSALKAADTDHNGQVTLSDALKIFKYKSGEITKL